MEASSFEESNGFLSKPHDMTDDECSSLSVWRGPFEFEGGVKLPTVVSCWKCTPAELEEIQRTGRVWLLIIGHTMPPACLLGVKPQPMQ